MNQSTLEVMACFVPHPPLRLCFPSLLLPHLLSREHLPAVATVADGLSLHTLSETER